LTERRSQTCDFGRGQRVQRLKPEIRKRDNGRENTDHERVFGQIG